MSRPWRPFSDEQGRVITAERERLHREEVAPLVEALRPFAEFVSKWDSKPLRGMDDVVYAIHPGTEWAAELRLSDMRRALAVLLAREERKK